MGQSVLTSAFARRDGVLYCEDVPAETIARQAGTPTFVYSAAVIRDRYRRLTAALVDGVLIAGAIIGSALVAAANIGHPLPAKIAEISAVSALLLAAGQTVKTTPKQVEIGEGRGVHAAGAAQAQPHILEPGSQRCGGLGSAQSRH